MNHQIHRLSLATLAACSLFLAGCESLGGLAGDLLSSAPKPEVALKNVSLKDIRADGVDLLADVEVQNPYAVPLRADGMGFQLKSGDSPLLSGNTEDAFSVPSGATSSIPVAVTLPFSDVFSALKDVRPGQVLPYTMDLDVDLVGEDVQPVGFDLSKSGELPIPAIPKVEVSGVTWDELGLSSAKGNLGMSLVNTNEFPLTLAGLDYALKLGGYEVSKGTAGTGGLKLAPGESGDIDLGFEMRPKDLGLAAFKMLSGGSADFELDGLLDTETPFGPMKLDFDKSGKTSLRK